MTNNSDQNIYSVIELKKSLKRTMIQLQKAIDILNQNSPNNLPNLTVVENLVKSSNALVDYLQLKKAGDEDSINIVESQEKETKINLVQKQRNFEAKKVKVSPSKEVFFFNFRQNLWLVIVLIISISFNIITLVNYSFVPNKNTTIANNQEIINEKPQEIAIGDNIFLDENSQVNQPLENTPSLEEKPYTRGENIFQEDTSSQELNKELDSFVPENNQTNNQGENNINNNLDENILLPENEENQLENNQDEAEKPSNLTLPEELKQPSVEPIEDDSNNKIKETEKKEVEEEISLLELTPEQYIIKNIKNQIINVTKKYGENLIVKVKANFSENSIVITLNEKWYKLNNNQQNNFANDIFNQVKSVDFYKFKLENTDGQLLARNAVVGDRLIIIP